MLSNRTIELVRLQVNIKDVVSDYATLQSSGRKLKCCCPLHNEKTPSFHIDPVRNTWHCFGACGEGGDAISFIEKKEKLSFIEAVRFLAKKHNIPVEEDTSERTPEQQEQDKQRESMLIAYEVVQKYYAMNIHNQDAYDEVSKNLMTTQMFHLLIRHKPAMAKPSLHPSFQNYI